MDISEERCKPNVPMSTPQKMIYTYGKASPTKIPNSQIENEELLYDTELINCSGDNHESFEQRKFFRRSRLSQSQLENMNGNINIKSGLEAGNRSEFLNLSPRTFLKPISPEDSSFYKSPIKTYRNPRKVMKSIDRSIESFGLPDDPIVADEANVCKMYGLLDAECPEESETTMLEMQNLDESWVVTNYQIGDILNTCEDFRIKAEPQRDFRTAKSSEALDKLFTSTPCLDRTESLNGLIKNQSDDNISYKNKTPSLKFKKTGKKPRNFDNSCDVLHSYHSAASESDDLSENKRSLRSNSRVSCDGSMLPNKSTNTSGNLDCSSSTSQSDTNIFSSPRELKILLKAFDGSQRRTEEISEHKTDYYRKNYKFKVNCIHKDDSDNKSSRKILESPVNNESSRIRELSVNCDRINVLNEKSKLNAANLSSDKRKTTLFGTNGATDNADDSFKDKLRSNFEKISDGVFNNSENFSGSYLDKKLSKNTKFSTRKSIEVSLELLQILPCNKDSSRVLLENGIANSRKNIELASNNLLKVCSNKAATYKKANVQEDSKPEISYELKMRNGYLKKNILSHSDNLTQILKMDIGDSSSGEESSKWQRKTRSGKLIASVIDSSFDVVEEDVNVQPEKKVLRSSKKMVYPRDFDDSKKKIEGNKESFEESSLQAKTDTGWYDCDEKNTNISKNESLNKSPIRRKKGRPKKRKYFKGFAKNLMKIGDSKSCIDQSKKSDGSMDMCEEKNIGESRNEGQKEPLLKRKKGRPKNIAYSITSLIRRVERNRPKNVQVLNFQHKEESIRRKRGRPRKVDINNVIDMKGGKPCINENDFDINSSSNKVERKKGMFQKNDSRNINISPNQAIVNDSEERDIKIEEEVECQRIKISRKGKKKYIEFSNQMPDEVMHEQPMNTDNGSIAEIGCSSELEISLNVSNDTVAKSANNSLIEICLKRELRNAETNQDKYSPSLSENKMDNKLQDKYTEAKQNDLTDLSIITKTNLETGENNYTETKQNTDLSNVSKTKAKNVQNTYMEANATYGIEDSNKDFKPKEIPVENLGTIKNEQEVWEAEDDVPLSTAKLMNHCNVVRKPESTDKVTTKKVQLDNLIKQEIVVEEINIKQEDGDFELGAIVWAQLGKNPFWPCLVTTEPVLGQFKKEQQIRNSNVLYYHVRFFGDRGRRAWIRSNRLILYKSRSDLSNIRLSLIAKDYPRSELVCYKIRNRSLKKWTQAVEEADSLIPKSVEERFKFFDELFVELERESESRRKSSDTAIKQEIDDDTIENANLDCKKIENVEGNVIADAPRKSMESKKIETTKRKVHKTAEDESEDKQIVKKSKRNESPMSTPSTKPTGNKRSLSKSEPSTPESVLEIEEEAKPKIVTKEELMAAQKRLIRRNYLFRGVPKEKVCNFCFEAGDVIKCSGPCSGLYHSNCAEKLMSWNTQMSSFINFSPDKKRKDEDNKDETYNTDNSAESDEAPVEKSNEEMPINDEFDERVQIVTVPSSIYNSPPKKVFPPDFQKMSLAEQIDYKMKEIMGKIEANTTNMYDYYPQGEDTIYDDNAVTSLEKKKNLNSVGMSNKIVEMNHVTADSSFIEDEKSMNTSSEIKQQELKNNDTSEFDKCETDKAIVAQQKTALKTFKCTHCTNKTNPFCFICHQEISQKGMENRQKCSLYYCGKFYHLECLKLWPQTQWSILQPTQKQKNQAAHNNNILDSFVCPQHVCHTCASENPRAAMARCTFDKTVRCLLCPSAYHTTNFCIPAGSEILTTTQIICPRHRRNKISTINTTWCFLCSEGGNLICCETCPTSVHPECLPVHLTDDNKFVCEDCESGRLPLYDEVVWVKLGSYRWWPALILFPNEVPRNLMNIKHGVGDFVVKFYGTHNYYWVSKGRSFLFQDGDTSCIGHSKKKYDEVFSKAVEEAKAAYQLKKEFRETQEMESLSSQKPPPYIRIKVNKPVGNVRIFEMNLSNTTSCECDPNQPFPCGPDSDCLNRLLMTECSPEVCPAGKNCNNQLFEKRQYPPLIPYKTKGRGWGLKTLEPIPRGGFIIEYVGEIIDDEEYQRRLRRMHEQKDENYYFLTIDKDRMIDAGPKGNLARFMNHCCQPNCETQKWTVNGNTRVGLFAIVDIPTDTELTFNYNLECIGEEKKICRCGASNCSGFIGVKAKQNVDSTEYKKPKKVLKKKKLPEPLASLPPCFVCKRKGKVELCNNKACNKAYHLRCIKITDKPEGNKFVCPWHNCNICDKRTIRCCVKCTNSYCPSHSVGNIRHDSLLGFICSRHDRTKPMFKIRLQESKKRKRNPKSDDDEDEPTVSLTADSEALNGPSMANRSKKIKKSLEKTKDSNEKITVTNDVSESSIQLSSVSNGVLLNSCGNFLEVLEKPDIISRSNC